MENFVREFSKLAGGERLVYFTGLLAEERDPRRGRNHPDLGSARLAWELYERGQAILAQRKVGRNKFEYLAIKRQSG